MKKNLVPYILIGVIAVGFILAGWFVYSSYKEQQRVRAEREMTTSEIGRIRGQNPSRERITYVRERKEDLLKDYENIAHYYQTPERAPVKKESIPDPLIFKQELLDREKTVMQEAKLKGVGMPDSLIPVDWKRKIFSKSDIPDAMKFVVMAEELAKSAFKAGVDRLVRIDYLRSTDREIQIPVREYGMTMTIESDYPELISFLYLLRGSEAFLFTDDIRIRAWEGQAAEGVQPPDIIADMTVKMAVFSCPACNKLTCECGAEQPEKKEGARGI